jgi:hypothetical protein
MLEDGLSTDHLRILNIRIGAVDRYVEADFAFFLDGYDNNVRIVLFRLFNENGVALSVYDRKLVNALG